jgi:thiol-disulfide isomerase/thioredoxin
VQPFGSLKLHERLYQGQNNAVRQPVIRVRWIVLALAIFAVAAILIARLGIFDPRPMPGVVVNTLKGEQYPLSSLRGSVVLVNFWATTCAVCMRDMPKLSELFEKYRLKGYRTVAVAMPYDPPNRVLDYVKRHPLPFDVALDVDGKVLRAFGDVPGTPTSFLVDKDGNIIRKYLGEPDFADLEQRIEHALAEG